MLLFLISFLVMMLAVAGMAVGILCGRRAIQGSCGGLNNIKGLPDGGCQLCGRTSSAEPCGPAQQNTDR